MSKPFTVLGYWSGSRPVSVGVIAGEHDVHAGENATREGDWAIFVEAETPDAAQTLAIQEMRDNEDDAHPADEEPDYDDSQNYDTNEEGDEL